MVNTIPVNNILQAIWDMSRNCSLADGALKGRIQRDRWSLEMYLLIKRQFYMSWTYVNLWRTDGAVNVLIEYS
jgi:hypothetical protein